MPFNTIEKYYHVRLEVKSQKRYTFPGHGFFQRLHLLDDHGASGRIEKVQDIENKQIRVVKLMKNCITISVGDDTPTPLEKELYDVIGSHPYILKPICSHAEYNIDTGLDLYRVLMPYCDKGDLFEYQKKYFYLGAQRQKEVACQ